VLPAFRPERTIVPFELPDEKPRSWCATVAMAVGQAHPADGAHGVVTAKASDWVRDPYKLIEDGWFYGRGTAT
jgi:hypothetical protein